MAVSRDDAQDELIRRNAESISRNEAAIRRQTECLEKIRDHYFPRKTFYKRTISFLLKVIGAVTVYAGLMETADWYWNTRQSEAMAEQSAAVAKRLFWSQNDVVGSVRFLEKAVELDSSRVKYRIALAYMKGFAVLVDLFDIGRPFTGEERARIDAVMADAIFLQESAPDEPMTHVLAAQAHLLLGNREKACADIDKAVALDPGNAKVHINACMVRLQADDMAAAKREIEKAAELSPDLPFVSYWKGMIALAEKDAVSARRHFEDMARRAPDLAVPHLMLGSVLLADDSAADAVSRGRAELEKALAILPKMKRAMLTMSDSYEREGNLEVARIWLDRVLVQDTRCMKALVARARVNARLGDPQAAIGDLSTALSLAPLRADLYLQRAEIRDSAGCAEAAAADRRTAASITR